MADLPEFEVVSSPLLLVTLNEESNTIVRIHPPQSYTHKHYGLLVADIVRHTARAFAVSEADVWEWVDKERKRPTTPIKVLASGRKLSS